MFFDHAHELSETECLDLLARASVGRVSLTIRALPVIVPVNYGYLGGSVVFGMADGPAQRAIGGDHVIALGVDGADLADAHWAVLVIGRAAEITNPDACIELERLGLTAPAHRAAPPHYLRLQPDLITGYRAI